MLTRDESMELVRALIETVQADLDATGESTQRRTDLARRDQRYAELVDLYWDMVPRHFRAAGCEVTVGRPTMVQRSFTVRAQSNR